MSFHSLICLPEHDRNYKAKWTSEWDSLVRQWRNTIPELPDRLDEL